MLQLEHNDIYAAGGIMKRLTTAVFTAFIAVVLTAAPALEAKNKSSKDSSAVLTAEPAKKQAPRKLTKKQRQQAEKEKNAPSMFSKSLFHDPALKHR